MNTEQVETMPITKNGKIDRKELMKIYKEQEALGLMKVLVHKFYVD